MSPECLRKVARDCSDREVVTWTLQHFAPVPVPEDILDLAILGENLVFLSAAQYTVSLEISGPFALRYYQVTRRRVALPRWDELPDDDAIARLVIDSYSAPGVLGSIRTHLNPAVLRVLREIAVAEVPPESARSTSYTGTTLLLPDVVTAQEVAYCFRYYAYQGLIRYPELVTFVRGRYSDETFRRLYYSTGTQAALNYALETELNFTSGNNMLCGAISRRSLADLQAIITAIPADLVQNGIRLILATSNSPAIINWAFPLLDANSDIPRRGNRPLSPALITYLCDEGHLTDTVFNGWVGRSYGELVRRSHRAPSLIAMMESRRPWDEYYLARISEIEYSVPELATALEHVTDRDLLNAILEPYF
jgi:hypothetical protein